MNKKTIPFVITLLIGVYIALQLVADVAAAKIVDVAGYTFPAGTFVFALTFTWRDLIHKRLGKDWARSAIIVAAVANIFMALYFWFVIHVEPAVFWDGQDAFNRILSVVPRITAASIVAELVSELLDTEVYQYLISRIPTRHQWGRVLGSNLVSLPVDSFVFATLAFYGDMPWSGLWSIMWGQIAFKALITIVSMPMIYAIPEKEHELQLEFSAAD